MNNDKDVDFMVTTFGIKGNGDATGLYAWTLPGLKYKNEDFPWPMYGHDRYRTNQLGFIPPDEPVGIQPISTNVPDKFSLYQNYPNPFNPITHLEFGISKMGFVSLKVFDVLGKEIAVLVNENLSPGSYTLVFDGSKFTSGVYFYKLQTVDFQETKRMILLK